MCQIHPGALPYIDVSSHDVVNNVVVYVVHVDIGYDYPAFMFRRRLEHGKGVPPHAFRIFGVSDQTEFRHGVRGPQAFHQLTKRVKIAVPVIENTQISMRLSEIASPNALGNRSVYSRSGKSGALVIMIENAIMPSLFARLLAEVSSLISPPLNASMRVPGCPA